MERLNYDVLKRSGYKGYILENAPEKILQFGEGNFLRAFVDYWFDMSNERAGWNGKAVLVQPIAPGLAKQINEQEGLYTLYLRGRENGEKVDRKRVISSVSRLPQPIRESGLRRDDGGRGLRRPRVHRIEHHRGGNRLRPRLRQRGLPALVLPREADAGALQDAGRPAKSPSSSSPASSSTTTARSLRSA